MKTFVVPAKTYVRPVLIAEKRGLFNCIRYTIVDSTRGGVQVKGAWIFTEADIVEEYDITIPNMDIDFERLNEEKSLYVVVLVRDNQGRIFVSKIESSSYDNSSFWTTVNAFIIHRDDLQEVV